MQMYVTYLLLAITIIVSVKAMDDNLLKGKFMLNAYDVVHSKKWYRAFTHGFIHADFMHLGFNMYVLYSFGSVLEQYLVMQHGVRGHMLFALLYLTGILFAALIPIAKNKDNPSYNALGASGAVSAIVFAYILIFPTKELGLMLLPFWIPAYIFGPLILLFEYIMSKRGGTGIAHDAHISGAIYGLIFMIALDYNYLLNFFNQFGS